MKSFKLTSFLVAVLVIAGLVISNQQPKDRDTLYQVSILDALMKGDYDGKVTLSKIRRHGDFGIGTFDRLDGEAIELDGIFYRVGSDGTVHRLSGNVKSPFFMGTFFGTDIEFSVPGESDYLSLQKLINSRLPTGNIPYAIKVEGKFSYIKTRSVPAQNKPYPLLSEVVKGQSIFEFKDIEGTLVGFKIPDYMRGVNMPGYHLHFISRDRTKGGHLLACVINSVRVKADDIDRFIMVLPGSPDFYRLDFSAAAGDAYKAE
jgi:acetolactate decarboxylase